MYDYFYKMKKLSKIDESIWSDIHKRSNGEIIRREDGKKVNTCLEIDITLKNPDCDYEDLIKKILNDDHDSFAVGIDNTRDTSYSFEELANARKFEAPYGYMIYDGGHGTDLIATFWTYDEMEDCGLNNFKEEYLEDDYISICKCIATKLKEVGGDFSHVPRNKFNVLGNSNPDRDYGGEYVLKLISEGDVAQWEYEYNRKNGDIYSLIDYKDDITYEFPELKQVDFIDWTFYDGVNIGIPLTFDTLVNFKKYKEFTNKWFCISVDESVWSDIHKRSNGSKERKEDDINLLDNSALCDYLNSQYKTLLSYDEIEYDKYQNHKDYIDYVKLPVFKYVDTYSHLYLNKNKDGNKNIHLNVRDIDIFKKIFPNFIDVLTSKFSINIETHEKSWHWSIIKISPKDGSPVTNTFFIEVLDELIKFAHYWCIEKDKKDFTKLVYKKGQWR